MRIALRNATNSQLPDHLGLAYNNRWAPLGDRDGKVPDDQRARWLQRLCELPLSQDYLGACARWRRSLEGDRSRAVEVRLATRLLLGHGNDSPTEVGLTVQHTWGAPMISGSALKGLLNHYVDAVYGPEIEGVHPLDPALTEEQRERARYQGVTYEGRQITLGPGEVHGALFGAPASQDDPEGASTGAVIFHDAWYLPSPEAQGPGLRPFAPDVLTVHQREYYNQSGKAGGPNDHGSPNPVSFLTVRPGARFLLALSGPPEWTGLAFELLREALCTWGVGGKTAAGYGRAQPESWTPVLGYQAPRPTQSAVLADFLGWLEAGGGTQKEQLDRVRADWLARLQALPSEERQQAAAQLEKRITSPKRAAELSALLTEVDSPGPGG